MSRFYARELRLDYPASSILIAGGARPLIYGIYRAVVDEGDVVVYPVPSWNNNHYCHMVGARPAPVVCGPEALFLPTRDDLVRELAGARLVCINSPLNPTGTAISAEALRGICEAIAEAEPARGGPASARSTSCTHITGCCAFEGRARHADGLVPNSRRFTIYVDGISKAFAATGLRVGWSAGYADIIERMSARLGHVGSPGPRAPSRSQPWPCSTTRSASRRSWPGSGRRSTRGWPGCTTASWPWLARGCRSSRCLRWAAST